MLAAQARRGARLAKEPLDDPGIAPVSRQQELQGHALFEVQVRRRDDHAHTALTEDSVDPVLVCDDIAWLHELSRSHGVAGGPKSISITTTSPCCFTSTVRRQPR